MIKFQEEGYQKDAQEIEQELRKKGYLSVDIAAVAYFLLNNNIDQTQKYVETTKRTVELLEKADDLLKSLDE